VKPVLFVTNHVAPNRVGAFEALAARMPLEVVTFGGKQHHGGGSVPFGTPVEERDVRALAAGDWRAVVCGISGRRALAGAFAGARGKPFVLWTSLWAHPRTAAQVAGYPLIRTIYRRAHAVVTYGEHVSAYVRAKGATNVHVAPQSVDNAFWSAPAGEKNPDFEVLFVGRDDPAKGLHVLREAWPEATAVTGGTSAEELRNFYARAHVLVVPSLRTRTFREPWGLVVNEAMNQRTAIIATDEVGAAAGGLVRHERNGLIVGAGDAPALRTAIERIRGEDTAAAYGAQGLQDVQAYTHDAWAAGFEAALRDC
jgi:glycosyltransferase involved in cell wall biosynthesis